MTKHVFEEVRNTREVTVCFRSKSASLTHIEPYFSFAESEDNVDALVVMRIEDKIDLYVTDVAQDKISPLYTDLTLDRWEHQCHVFSRGFYRAFIDGEERASGDLTNKEVLLPLRAAFCPGMEQDSVGGGFDSTQVFRGHMAQINIWDRPLDPLEVSDIASCRIYGEGNVFSSDVDVMEEIGTTSEMVPLSDLCLPSENFFILPSMQTVFEGMDSCYRMGYALYVPGSLRNNERLFNSSLQFLNVCTNPYVLWLGVLDEEEEDVWRRVVDNEIVETQFAPGQPDGKRIQNCAYMSSVSGQWSDEQCDLKVLSCIPCIPRKHPPLNLRGLCFRMKAETAFEILGYVNARPYFHGFYGYMIFMSGPATWDLFDTNSNKTLARARLSSVSDYPIGRKNWIVQSTLCDIPKDTRIDLSLSYCLDSQFTCANGDCISKEQRCNSQDDCADFSDENECYLVQLPSSYRVGRPPESVIEGEPTRLASTVRILRFHDISDVRRSISLEFMLIITWKDARLKFFNLKDTREWNKLAQSEMESIWRPQLEFPSAQDGNSRMLKQELFLSKGSDPLPAEFNDIKMEAVYSGESTSLIQEQHYSGTFACHFDVFYYPFDKQECSVLIKLASVRQENVSFVQDEAVAEYFGLEELPLYVVRNFHSMVTYVGDNQTRYSTLSIDFQLTRRWTVIMMNLYFPTNMLLATGYATLFLNVHDQGDRLTLSLTTLLVLYTLFNNSSSSLPVTAYVKMVDMWFLYCISLLFVIIVCHTLAGYKVNQVHPTGDLRQKGSMVNNFVSKGSSRFSPEKVLATTRVWVVPPIVLVFNAAYWASLVPSLSK
ncbi:uncharacterized protein LOC123518714 [Portunus trituberculatus]|uniref:uncharacterized protein LOC123518714 n=1 Tax=Portunus trituberculatus TaxID=210409 RepID=UPI001E1D1B54|nr:uncharacterized protein LOC123518714 [Portunus trituberculatus]